MKEIPKIPQCKPIDHISPSLATDLEQCMYKAGQKRTSQYRRFFEKSSSAYLGMISHRVINRAFTGEGLKNLNDESLKETAEKIWDEEIQKLLSKNDNIEKGEVSNWPKYGMKKARTIKKAKKILEKSIQKRSQFSKENLIKIEENIKDESGKIRGRPDRFYKVNSKLVVEEFKSGSIKDENGMVLERFKKQILIYCWLVEKEVNQWPDLARIQTLEGSSYQQKPIKKEAEKVVQRVLNILEEYNKKLNKIGKRTGNQINDLATPSTEACKWCRIRAWCIRYWNSSVPRINSSEYREDVQGKLQKDWAPPAPMRLLSREKSTFKLGLDPQITDRVKKLPTGSMIRCINARIDRKGKSYLADGYSEIWWGDGK